MTSRRRNVGHTITDIRFAHRGDSQLAPLDCSCGWTGTVGAFPQHRDVSGAGYVPKPPQKALRVSWN